MHPMRRTVFLTMTLALVACQKEAPSREIPLGQLGRHSQADDDPEAGAPTATPMVALSQGSGGGVEPAVSPAVAGIAWSVPSNWRSRGPAPMRVATYAIPPAAGDTEGGELAVFFFGTGQGGDVRANLERWYGQMEQPDGRPSGPLAKVAERTAGGVKVTTVSVDGTYLWSPRPMSSEKVKKPGYRLLGAIAEAPGGNVFFKLTAPAKTAAAAGFDAFVASIHKS